MTDGNILPKNRRHGTVFRWYLPFMHARDLSLLLSFQRLFITRIFYFGPPAVIRGSNRQNEADCVLRCYQYNLPLQLCRLEYQGGSRSCSKGVKFLAARHSHNDNQNSCSRTCMHVLRFDVLQLAWIQMSVAHDFLFAGRVY